MAFSRILTICALVFGCTGALACGTVFGWSANITNDLKTGKLNGFNMTEDEVGWSGSSVPLGGMVICIPTGIIGDWIGRKFTLLLTAFPFAAGYVLIIFAQHIAMVYVGRILAGIAAGCFCVIAPVYISEIAQTKIRGRLGTFYQLFVTIGILLAGVFGYAVPMMAYHFILLGISIAFGISFLFQPETPVYLLRRGKKDKAVKAFQRLRGKEYDPSDEIKELEAEIAKEAESPGCWQGMKKKAAKKATVICFMLMLYLQLSGINAVIFYTNEIFTSAGASLAAHWSTIIIGAVQVVATMFSSWSVDKIGRKILLITSCGLMTFSCFLLGLFFTLKDRNLIDEETVTTISFLPILSLVLFIIAFSIGIGPITWVTSSEILLPEVKAKCLSCALMFNWLLAFIVTRSFLNVVTAIGSDGAFYFFGCVMATGLFFVLFVIPETKGKTFLEINALLEGK